MQNYYLPTILLQQCMVGLLNRFSNHCANNVLCFFISKHGFFSPHLLKNIFAMHVNSTELMNAELNLLMDAPVVTSASCHPAWFPHTRRHIFHSAWPGPQALPPAISPCWVIITIPFAPPFYTINCEGRETRPLPMYRYLHVAQEVLQQGKGVSEPMDRGLI